jgi:hypothetical protein
MTAYQGKGKPVALRVPCLGARRIAVLRTHALLGTSKNFMKGGQS